LAELQVLGVCGDIVEVSKSEDEVQVFDHYKAAGDRSLFVAQRMPDRVRCLCPDAANGLAPGDPVRPAPAINPGALSRSQVVAAVRCLASYDENEKELCTTGIIAFDIFCPIPRRGAVCLIGGGGSGRMTMVEELHRRLGGQDLDILVVFLIKSRYALLVPESMKSWPDYPPDVSVGVATAWLSCDDADAPDLAEQVPGVGAARPIFSRRLAARGVLPPIDTVKSCSDLLGSRCATLRHRKVVSAINELIARVERFRTDRVFDRLLETQRDLEAARRDREVCGRLLKVLSRVDREALRRVLRLERHLSQAFFCRERLDGRSGTHVAPAEGLDLCEDIVWGKVDDVDVG
jgi:F0F1-type ATP synthase beta subunit